MKKYNYPLRKIICGECEKEHEGHFSHVQRFCSETCRYKNQNKRDYVSDQKRKYLTDNPEKRKMTSNNSRIKNWNKPSNVERRKKYSQKLEIRMKNVLRSRIKKFLKDTPKKTRTLSIVGCTALELKTHLEKQFDERMNWDN